MEKKNKDKELKNAIDSILIKKRKYRDPDFSARKLAEELGTNQFQLSRDLKRIYGMAYSDIILPLRIKEAKKQLINPKRASYSVEDIGVLVGFNNKWSFFQAFRKYTDTTPNEWKKRSLGEDGMGDL